MNKRTHKSTPPEVNVQSTTIYSQRYLALLILHSRLNTRNSPGACRHCNCQPFSGSSKTTKFYQHKIFFMWINFSWKFPDLW